MYCFECNSLISQPGPRPPSDGSEEVVQYLRCSNCKATYRVKTKRVPNNTIPKDKGANEQG